MALTDSRLAWVNGSNITIPVYGGLTSSSVHIGGTTVNTNQTGSIAPNSFYTVVPHGTNCTYREIRFRNSSGNLATGFIETSPGMTLGDYAWVQYQSHYHIYNSNGTGLVPSATEVINGTTYRIFTISGSTLQFLNSAGAIMGTLPIGAKLATTSSTVGVSNPHYMYFRYRTLNGAWVDMVSNGDPWGFVDMRIGDGVTPSARRIR